MAFEDLVGIQGEVTTYRRDYRPFVVSRRDPKSSKEADRPEKLKWKKKTQPIFAESHDTFQKLDYESKPPFDALWRAKEIVGTDPRIPLCRKFENNEKSVFFPARKSNLEYMSPAVNVDHLHDPEARKTLANYLYKSTLALAAEDSWSEFEKSRAEKTERPLEKRIEAIKSQIGEYRKGLPDQKKVYLVPENIARLARSWDSQQSRRLVG